MEKIQHARIDDQRKKACVKLIVTNLKTIASQHYSNSYVKKKIRFYEKKWDKARKQRFSWFFYRMDGSDRVLLGTGSYNSEGQIMDVFVDVDHQRRGVGREIMAHLESRMVIKQLPKAFVYCGSHAVPFYQNLGYTEIERVDQKGDFEIKMEKKLPRPVRGPPRSKSRARMSTAFINDAGDRLDNEVRLAYEEILIQNYSRLRKKLQLDGDQEVSIDSITITGVAGDKTYTDDDLKEVLHTRKILAARGSRVGPAVPVQNNAVPPTTICGSCRKVIDLIKDVYCPHCGNPLAQEAIKNPLGKSALIKYTKEFSASLIQLSRSAGAQLQTSDPGFQKMTQIHQRVMAETHQASAAELNESVLILNRVFAEIQPGLSFIAMVTVGAFVEFGADADPAYEAVIPYFEGVLNQIGNPAAIPMVYEIASRSYIAIVAILSKSKSARKRIKERQRFMGPLGIVWKNFSGGEYLREITHVEDDQGALVLHPESAKGYLVNYGGISSGFQLQTLLEDFLIHNGDPRFLSGTKNDPGLVAQMKNAPITRRGSITGHFSLFRAGALDENGRLPDSVFGNMAAWISGEDLPVDLPRIDGRTCILLSEQKGNIKINRSWNSERRFPQMEASMSLEKILTQPEVEDYLKRIATLNHSNH